MKKLKKINLSKGIAIVLMVLTFFIVFVPRVQAKPLRSEMEVYFNPDFGGPENNPIWIGYIHGDLEGTMKFWATGPIPEKDVGYNAENWISDWNVHFFTEDWEIITPEGTIRGIDKGCTVASNWKFRMNGEVRYADGAYAHLVGHQVHMHGQINWAEWSAIGPVNIN